jgi:trehalose synthase
MAAPDPEYMQWLVDNSMLQKTADLALGYSGKASMWRSPYAMAHPRAASALSSVWFTAYAASTITRPGESVLTALGNEEFWQALNAIGVEGLHSGPMKQAGGLMGRGRTPSVDGNFDRMGLEIDRTFGTSDEFVAMSNIAAAHGAIIIDDIIPGHTGKGADFRLAELGFKDFPGLYHMVEIAPEDWDLLPPVPPGRDAVNLSPEVVDQLAEKGYIVGPLPRTIFYEPGVKETDWSATYEVTGVDGIDRRWVYLHYFKQGQPTLNWLDPSFAAPRLVLGDALHAIEVLGVRMLRLDANGFLGIERNADGTVWSEGHPLSITANQIIAGMVRKLGGFTFQELNLTVDDIAAMSQGGADMAYDFITRPAYQHALVTGDTEFLRLMLNTMHYHRVDPAGLVHALQNHDELTLELVHFWRLHDQDTFTYHDQTMTGSELREHIREVMYERLAGPTTPYNLRFVNNGIACTTASICAAALGINDLADIGPKERAQIQKMHLLLAMYNAYQPGIFALSGWDLVGALPLSASSVAARLSDGDTRWINRGGYDLMDVNPDAAASPAGLPKAATLYGPLPEQLQDPNSFACQLRRLLEVRKQCQIYASVQLEIPNVTNKGLLVMVHRLPASQGIQVTALNFGAEPIEETIQLSSVTSGVVTEMLSELYHGSIGGDGALSIQLDGYSGKSYLIQ